MKQNNNLDQQQQQFGRNITNYFNNYSVGTHSQNLSTPKLYTVNYGLKTYGSNSGGQLPDQNIMTFRGSHCSQKTNTTNSQKEFKAIHATFGNQTSNERIQNSIKHVKQALVNRNDLRNFNMNHVSEEQNMNSIKSCRVHKSTSSSANYPSTSQANSSKHFSKMSKASRGSRVSQQPSHVTRISHQSQCSNYIYPQQTHLDQDVIQLESPNENGEGDLDLVSIPISDLKGTNNEKSAQQAVNPGYPVLDISSIKNTTSDIQLRSEMKATNMQHLYNLELSQISQATSNPNFAVTQPKNMSFGGGNQKGNQKNMQQIRIQKQQNNKNSYDSRKTSRQSRNPPKDEDQLSEMESSQPTELMAASDDLNEFISQKKKSQHQRQISSSNHSQRQTSNNDSQNQNQSFLDRSFKKNIQENTFGTQINGGQQTVQMMDKKELQASPSRVMCDNQIPYNSNQNSLVNILDHDKQKSTFTEISQSNLNIQNVTANNITKNIFYKEEDTSIDQKKIFALNQVNMQVEYDFRAFKNNDENKKMITNEKLILRDFTQKIAREIFFFKIQANTDDLNIKHDAVQQICEEFNHFQVLQGGDVFENISSSLNELFINQIIDLESQPPVQFNHYLLMQDYIIDEKLPTIHQPHNRMTHSTRNHGGKQISRSEQDLKSIKDQIKHQRQTNSIHNALYLEGQLKQEQNKIIQQERKLQLQVKEVENCTFSPQNQNEMIQSSYQDSKRSKSMQFQQDGKPIRSPEKFFKDMMQFKNVKQQKLVEMRIQENLSQKNQFSNNKKASEQYQKDLFQNLTKEKLKKTQTTINLKQLANKCTPSNGINSHRSKDSNKKAFAVTDQLYNDHLVRENKKKALAKSYNDQLKQKQGGYTLVDVSKSNQILANKIAQKTKSEYDAIVKDYVDGINSQRLALKQNIQTIREEYSLESDTGSKKGTFQEHQLSMSSTVTPEDIEGITYDQFLQLCANLGYITMSQIQDVIQAEMQQIDQAWLILSHYEIAKEQRQIISLRNLIILLIAIHNIYIDSMTLKQKQLQIFQENSALYQKVRKQVGFFMGPNYFIENEHDTRKLAQMFELLVKNQNAFEKQMQLKEQVHKKENANTFMPKINAKSEKIVNQKMKDVYTQKQRDNSENQPQSSLQSARGELKKYGNKYEDFLINKGKQSKIKQMAKAKELEMMQTKGCTFRPQINRKNSNNRGSRSVENLQQSSQRNVPTSNQSKTPRNQGNVFENLYKVAINRRECSKESLRTAKNRELEQFKKECTFKPNLNKTQQINQNIQSKLYSYKDPEIMKSQFNNTQDLNMLKSLSNSSINGTQHQQSHKQQTSGKPQKQGDTLQSHREKKIKPSLAKKFINKKTREENFSINNIDEHTPVQRSYRENEGAQNIKSSLSTISPESYSLSNSRFGNRKKSQQSAVTNTKQSNKNSGQNSAGIQTPYQKQFSSRNSSCVRSTISHCAQTRRELQTIQVSSNSTPMVTAQQQILHKQESAKISQKYFHDQIGNSSNENVDDDPDYLEEGSFEPKNQTVENHDIESEMISPTPIVSPGEQLTHKEFLDEYSKKLDNIQIPELSQEHDESLQNLLIQDQSQQNLTPLKHQLQDLTSIRDSQVQSNHDSQDHKQELSIGKSTLNVSVPKNNY